MNKSMICTAIRPALVILTCIAAGCSTTGYNNAQSTSKSLQATRASVAAADSQVVNTVKTLERMYNTPGADLVSLYKQLNKDISQVKKQAKDAQWRATSYRKNANQYLDAWSKELSTIADDSVRIQSAERREQVLAKFRAIERSAAACRQAYGPFIKELDGIAQYLGQDLTAQGLTAMTPQGKNARARATALRQTFSLIARDIDLVAADLAPRTP